MKILHAVTLDQYRDETRYLSIGANVYEELEKETYCITLYCELENGEDKQYPLEDLLDKYYVTAKDYTAEQNVESRRAYVVELRGKLLKKDLNFKNIDEVSKLIGKRVFNYEEKGCILLGIE